MTTTDPGQYNMGTMTEIGKRQKNQHHHKVQTWATGDRFGGKSKKNVVVGPATQAPSVHHYNHEQQTSSFGGMKTFNERLRAQS